MSKTARAKILVANRGEIAVRIIRAARELGLATVAVYSECDADALHVRLADEAWEIGPAEARFSYLNSAAILAAAEASGATAIHPGYGFLAENAEFAEAVGQAGLIFIGPSPAVIAQMGSKIAARRLAEKTKVPMVPGTFTPLRDAGEAAVLAAKIGYPVLLKAAFGGGGKGMRRVEAAAEMPRAFELATGEAAAAFKNGDLYLEKFILEPHHIEIQVLGDPQGNIIHLFERECSIQRRHQKIVEEAPSPFISEKTRQKICTAALRLAKAAGYYSAGTLEFLVDRDQNFYFLEMNTRIQVEHPITEMITGIDLVKAQIQTALGEPLRITQAEVKREGHAIECRIYAEDPFANFLPSPGTITGWREPSGPGIRLDSGVTAGSLVPIHYDPVLGKLIAWGRNRNEALQRMERALAEFRISGITTNLFFHRRLLRHPKFRKGDYDTHFIEAYMQGEMPADAETEKMAVVAAAIGFMQRKPSSAPIPALETPSLWKLTHRREGLR